MSRSAERRSVYHYHEAGIDTELDKDLMFLCRPKSRDSLLNKPRSAEYNIHIPKIKVPTLEEKRVNDTHYIIQSLNMSAGLCMFYFF